MLENIQENTYNLVTSSRFWMILAVVLLFLIVAAYVYSKYVTPLLDTKYIPNKEFIDTTSDDKKEDVELIIFTVEWCPHSKKAIPIWNELKETYPDRSYNGYNLRFTEINGEENPDMADKYKVEGYPTIKLIKGNQVIEYDAKPSLVHLKEFLQSTLHP